MPCSRGAHVGAMAVAAPATVAVLLAVEAGEGGSLLGVWQVRSPTISDQQFR